MFEQTLWFELLYLFSDPCFIDLFTPVIAQKSFISLYKNHFKELAPKHVICVWEREIIVFFLCQVIFIGVWKQSWYLFIILVSSQEFA